MNLQNVILDELKLLRHMAGTDPITYGRFLKRVTDNPHLIRAQSQSDHACSFFLPFHRATRSIYLIHHRKAGSWIPPGGHIDPMETPVDTVRREYKEELSYSLTDEKIELFDLSIKQIEPSSRPCRVHYDLWYLVECREQTPYRFLEKEFHDASWFPIEKGVSIMEHEDYRLIVAKLSRRV